MSRVLVAGCGWLGGALARRLVVGGHEVLGLRRGDAPLPEGVVPLQADLAEPSSLAGLPRAVDAVVYAASPGERSDAAYERTFVTGVRNLREALTRGSPELARFVFVSSTAVYSQRDGSWVDEGSPAEPTHFSGRRLLLGERLARDGPGAGCALRLGGLYGPGRTGLLDRVRRGEARYAPGPPRYANRIHRDDAVSVLEHLLMAEAPPVCLLGVDSAPAPEREVLEGLADRLGAPAPRPAEPAAGSRAALGNRRCSNALLLARGLRLRYPSWREGYEALLAG